MKKIVKIFLLSFLLISVKVNALKTNSLDESSIPSRANPSKSVNYSSSSKKCIDSKSAFKIANKSYTSNVIFKYGNIEENYSTYIYKIKVNNQIYDGFCIDPGSKSVSSSDCLTCDALDESKGYGLLTRKMIELGYFENYESDPHRIGIPYRFLAVLNGDVRLNVSGNEDLSAFIAYNELRLGMTEETIRSNPNLTAYEKTQLIWIYNNSEIASSGGKKFIAGKTPSGNDIDELYDLARDTYLEAGSSANISSDTNGGLGGISIELISDNGLQATLKATVPYTLSTIEYTCNGCEFVNEPEVGVGKSTTFTVNVTDPNCKFTIGVVTSGGGVYLCHEDTSKQQYIMYAPDGNMTNNYEFSLPTCEICVTTGERTENVESVDPSITGEVNNCCGGGPTEVEEIEIDELFSYDDCYLVPGYRVKRGASAYRNTDVEGTYDKGKIDPDYCELYCTQRARIDIPGEISAVNGRYFVLKDQTVDVLSASINTTGPVAQGFKRCRLRIKYADWLKNYMQEIDNEITSYNNYQEFKKRHELTDEVVKTKETKSHQYVVSCVAPTVTASKSCPSQTQGGSTESCSETKNGDTQSHTFSNFNYYKYNYNNYQGDKWRRWYEVKIKDSLVKTYGLYKYYDQVELEDDKENHQIEYQTMTWQLLPRLKEAEEWAEQYEGKEYTRASVSCCSGDTVVSTYSCTINHIDDEKYQNYNVEGLLEQLYTQYHDAADSYSVSTKAAKILENKLYVCDNYFGQYEGAAAGNMFEFDPDSTFYYTQVYLDDLGSLAKSTTGVDFVKVCKQDPTEVPDPGLFKNKIGDVIGLRDTNDGLTAQNTSGIFGGGYALMKDFRCAAEFDEGIKASSFEVSGETHEGSMEKYKEANCSKESALGLLGKAVNIPNAFTRFLDIDYLAGKQFTMDARYHAYCYWEEQDNTKYTLVPYGDVNQGNTNVTIRNYNIHNKHYEVYLTTLDGTFETHWDMSNIGENGVFDEFISKNGTTCANQTASDKGFSPFTCKLKVTHQLVRTGGCDGVVDDADHCYIDNTSKEGYMLYSFKVVDYKNLFPICDNKGTKDNCYNSIGYAYNWLYDEIGKQVLEEIESGEAFDIDNLTYSFVLSGADMKKIREYNRIQIEKGGYTDFELSCKNACMGENGYTIVDGQVVKSDDACNKCYSDFLGSLANGKINIDGNEESVSGWSNSQKTLSYIREHNNW